MKISISELQRFLDEANRLTFASQLDKQIWQDFSKNKSFKLDQEVDLPEFLMISIYDNSLLYPELNIEPSIKYGISYLIECWRSNKLNFGSEIISISFLLPKSDEAKAKKLIAENNWRLN